MPSTYSTSLRLELMGAGDQAGNWGNTTNTNLGSLIEQAITGVGRISIPSDANYTLTVGSGIVDQSRNAVLIVESDVSLTATRNLIVPSVNKFYAVRNVTTGNQSILVKTSAGSGVTLANGLTQLMYCDGTNVVLASPPMNAATGDLSVTGTVLSGGGPVMPTGSILEYGGTTAPTGWLLCDGAEVSRSTYSALWNVIGDAYGDGDGSLTFNLPDKRDRVAVGAGSTYLRGATGGSATATTSEDGAHSHGGTTNSHTLLLTQIPSHRHSGTTTSTGSSHDHGTVNYFTYQAGGTEPGYEAGGYFSDIGTASGVDFGGSHTHTFTTDFSGESGGHNHVIPNQASHQHTASTIQPYVASNFIIKT